MRNSKTKDGYYRVPLDFIVGTFINFIDWRIDEQRS